MVIEDVMHKKLTYEMNSEVTNQNILLQESIEDLSALDNLVLEVDATDNRKVLVMVSFYSDRFPDNARNILDKLRPYMVSLHATDMTGHAV
jgi:hypothetical protein